MTYDYGQWILVIGVSALFLLLTYDAFKPKTHRDWRSFGLFSAFIIALFTEMYGFPLTIYLLSSQFGNRFPSLNFTHAGGHLWEVLLDFKGDPHWNILHLLSTILIFGGIILIAAAWKILYPASQNNTLAMTGPYRFIRHPQYSGFILIIAGFLLQWPTLITLVMAPILVIRYVRLALSEEKTMMQQYGKDYLQYQQAVPRFCPSVPLLLAGGKQTNEGKRI